VIIKNELSLVIIGATGCIVNKGLISLVGEPLWIRIYLKP